jgi:Domain of unknown function (DUF6265)
MRVLVALLIALLAGATSAQPTATQLGWLAGCWAATDAELGSGEQWTAPAGGLMLGVARTLRRDRPPSHEFMQIRDTAQGLVLIALPSGQREATFTVQQIDTRSVAFENLGHDFPQRVIYLSSDADTLEGRIEGLRNGQLRTIRFPMKRTRCPLGAAP